MTNTVLPVRCTAARRCGVCNRGYRPDFTFFDHTTVTMASHRCESMRGACPQHRCYSAYTAAEYRAMWMADVFAPITHHVTSAPEAHLPLLLAIIDRVLTEGPNYGTSGKWNDALLFFAYADNNYGTTARDRMWAVIQGSIVLSHAS